MSPNQATPPNTSPTGFEPEAECLLFRTQVNGQWCAFDPWRLGRIIARELGGEPLGKVIRDFQGEPQRDETGRVTHYLPLDPQLAFDAGERLYGAIAAAFGLGPVRPDGSGVTEKTLHRLLDEYLAWKAAVKKNFASSRTSTPSAAPNSPVPAGLSAISNGIASGSCGVAFGPSAPPGSPMP